MARFIAEAKAGESTWDFYVGVTPFVEMAQLIAAGAIEPWDPYIPKEVLDDLLPAIREECTVDGKLYVWPFLLDVIVEAQNNAMISTAGLPDKIPDTWDEYLANAKTVLDKGAAKYGCTFDCPWLALAGPDHPQHQHQDVYYMLEGDKTGLPLFDFTSEPAIEALKIMKQMLDLSSANALQPGRHRRRRQPDPGRGGVRGGAGALLHQVPECAAALRRKLEGSDAVPPGRPAEDQGRRRRHDLLGHRRVPVQVRQEQGSRPPST